MREDKGSATPSVAISDSEADAAEYVLQNITSLKEVDHTILSCWGQSLKQVSSDEWNACLASSKEWNPFTTHEFLVALEESGSAVSSHACLALSVIQ